MTEHSWIEHDGRSWPQFSPSDLVEVERRNGYGHTDHACGFMWLSSGSPYDIIRYRKVAS
jgi:SH3-like domain-containing protein